ncbi:MAG: fructosamine kinase family protein [Gammaproteobacteria bacterium]|nr:fructosamine kinase family protein [Gammaproteobacteria bacterium]MDP6617548.1 fructosamine kinase family protein [Gammaproteobacteria bacterium]MDP6694425.1 fructosamine kinase family protein [Gammaproteobacteria bacterium]MDP7041118.1 fructosamine kinase family protein [Gammaproteobacteria bacterium]
MADYAELLEQVNATAGTNLVPDSSMGVAGGDINQAVQVFDRNSRGYFLKLNDRHFADMFAAEFAGLEELSRSAIRVPEPIAFGSGDPFAWLLLEWLDLEPPTLLAAETFGTMLADMHRIEADTFGWTRDNTIGRTPQKNKQTSDWIAFLRDRRLGYQLQLAADNGAGGSVLDAGAELLDNLDNWFSTYSPNPSLLHGDLWGGNWGMLGDGTPVIFDPAVYYGDRETDIAMTRLFGGFDSGFYQAYAAVWPLDEGFEARQDLYNLYHVLNHYNLFGGHYLAQADRMLQSLVAQP